MTHVHALGWQWLTVTVYGVALAIIILAFWMDRR